jgi:hypothetical protein
MSSSAQVHRHIDAAIAYTTDPAAPRGSRYQRGRPLVTHLENAAKAAGRAGEAALSNRLADFAEYAAGVIPLTVLESRYDPRGRESDDHYMRMLLGLGLRRSGEILGEYLKDRPEASGQDAHAWILRVADAMDAWSIGEARNGGVRLPRYAADRMTWLKRMQLVLDDHGGDAEIPPELAEELSSVPGAELVARAIDWTRRKQSLDRLRAVVERAESTEWEIHAELKQQTWIFGGRYIKELTRRRLTTTDEIDIPLLRGDGSLHVIELKKAAIPYLVEAPRSHCTVGPEVHKAVTQAANYLRSLDENRASILADHGIECRRASATVLIGHPAFVEADFTAAEIAAAFRTYNGILSRIDVMTYEELIDSAERTLAVSEGL